MFQALSKFRACSSKHAKTKTLKQNFILKFFFLGKEKGKPSLDQLFTLHADR